MKKNLIQLLLIALPSFLGAQISKYPSIIAGTESGGIFSIPNSNNPSDFPRYWSLRFAPHVSVQLYKRLYVGAQVEYSFGKVEYEKLVPRRGAGITLKYLFHNNSSNGLLRNRFVPYTELSWNLLNYTIDGSKVYGYEPLNKFSNHNIQGLLGVNFRLFDRLYLDYALRLMHYTQKKKFMLVNRVGLQYHFGEQRVFSAPPVRTASSSKRLKLFDFRYFLKNSLLTGRYAHIFDKVNTSDMFYYQQRSTSLAFSTSLSSDIYLGLLYQPIWISVRGQGSQYVHMVGPMLQYDFLREPMERRLFIELGYFRGNLCTCGEDAPYKKDNLSYIPVGVGYERRIKDTKLYWSLSAHFYRILADPNLDPETYLHPTAGIVYRLSEDKALVRQ